VNPIIRERTIGNCRLIQGDCLAVMPLLSKVDHVICDPPYEALVHENNKRLSTGRQLKDKRNPFTAWNFDAVDDIRADFCAAVKAASNGWFVAFCIIEGVKPWEYEINEAGMKYKRACLWIKPDGMPQFNGQCPGIGYECFVTAWAGAGHSKWNGGGKHGVYYCNKGEGRFGGHPTEKPVRLMVGIVEDFTQPKQTVLDPFMGSGTTGVACIRTGRSFIGIEKDSTYFDIACERVQKAYDQPDFFVEPAPKPVQEALL
jgi:site-specific DNA-methyltransferase (adenine-specific)